MRLTSVDVFRGATMAAMVIVNTPGDWANVYWPLLHADWHGWTPTDLIFPFFVFIVGVAIVLAKKSTAAPGPVFRRAAVIFGLGLLLALPALVLVEHLDRARAVAAVVEVDDVRVEEEASPHARQVSHGAGGAPAPSAGMATTIENMALTKDDPLSTHAEPSSHPSFARPWRVAGARAGGGRPRAHR